MPLPRVPVANAKQGATRMNGKIQGCARDEIFVIHVAAMYPGWATTHSAGQFWRRHADTSKEWPKRNVYSVPKMCDTSHFVKRNDFHFGRRKLVSQNTGSRVGRIVCIREG